MPAVTTAYVKNIIRRGLRELVDPSPDRDESADVWRFFNSQCAYCGKTLAKGNKEGHIDHLISASKGGPNHISNRVLSCAICNESEKLDADWDDFLKRKANNPDTYETRKQKILEWQKTNPISHHAANPKAIAEVSSMADQIVAIFDKTVQDIRRKYG